jgi:hypothetical protein
MAFGAWCDTIAISLDGSRVEAAETLTRVVVSDSLLEGRRALIPVGHAVMMSGEVRLPFACLAHVATELQIAPHKLQSRDCSFARCARSQPLGQ